MIQKSKVERSGHLSTIGEHRGISGQWLDKVLRRPSSLTASDRRMATPPELNRLVDSKASPEFSPTSVLLPSNLNDDPWPQNLVDYIRRTLLDELPNDLTRMIYMASLRDCNSGLYLHPELSRQRGLEAVDRALHVCHKQVFRQLLSAQLSEYVSQLLEYIRYARGETFTVLETWRSLQAYRATIPVGAPAVSTELFCLNIAIAIEILCQEMPELRHD